jgi:hypothetical protein
MQIVDRDRIFDDSIAKVVCSPDRDAHAGCINVYDALRLCDRRSNASRAVLIADQLA